MKEFLLKPKVTLTIAAIILAIILSGVYLYATLRPGFWIRNTFLYEQKDGSFQGSDHNGQYALVIRRDGNNTTAAMTINDITRVYEIRQDGTDVQILQDGKQVFVGTVTNHGLLDSSGLPLLDIEVYAENAGYTTEQLFPNIGWIYRCAHRQDLSTRGQPWVLAFAWFCAAWIIVDILFPNLFFHLRYMWYVDGGEPSDIYRSSQMIGRVAMLILIVVILIMGFNHP